MLTTFYAYVDSFTITSFTSLLKLQEQSVQKVKRGCAYFHRVADHNKYKMSKLQSKFPNDVLIRPAFVCDLVAMFLRNLNEF